MRKEIAESLRAQRGITEEGEDGTPTLGGVLEAAVHASFTVAADQLRANGKLDQEERIFLSSCIGDALSTFTDKVKGESELYDREV